VISAIDITFKVLLLAQIKAAQEAGYEVHGICCGGPNWDFLCSHGIKMYSVEIKRKISLFMDIIALWMMYRYFKKERIDIVHTHTPKCSLLGQFAARFAGVPVIVNTVHGFYFHDNMKPLVRWFYIAMEWIAGKCSTMILSQNPEDVETAIKLKICKPDRIKFLGNGVDLNKFDPKRFEEKFKKEKRKEIGIPEDATVICIIGRLVKEKGFLELFEAFREIIKEHNDVWLMIIGPEEPEKTDRISADTFKQYDIENRTIYLGARDDIPELLACCDIYALPSWREGFPRSAIEAAAMGLPIVTTDIRGCRQVVEDGVNGFLTPVHDMEKLKEAIMKLINDKEMRVRMGKAGYHKSRKEFDEKNICRIVIETYENESAAKRAALNRE
jgi:glycosyltransferase involved in cell wall biosynthesis